MTINLLAGTGEIIRWRETTRPTLKPAPWLTDGLIGARLLSADFKDARVAPIVVGIAFERQRRHVVDVEGMIKASVDADYLTVPPVKEFNPHNALKNSVRTTLEASARGKKRPDVALFPGYVFPDVLGGGLYLDNTLSDGTCTPERLAPASGVLSESYGIGTICVGSEVLVQNDFGFTPDLSLPSVVREAMHPEHKGGDIKPSIQGFVRAARVVQELEQRTSLH